MKTLLEGVITTRQLRNGVVGAIRGDGSYGRFGLSVVGGSLLGFLVLIAFFGFEREELKLDAFAHTVADFFRRFRIGRGVVVAKEFFVDGEVELISGEQLVGDRATLVDAL